MMNHYLWFMIRKLSPVGEEKIESSKHLINDDNMLAIFKEVKSNPKQPNCKKKICSPQEGYCEKM